MEVCGSICTYVYVYPSTRFLWEADCPSQCSDHRNETAYVGILLPSLTNTKHVWKGSWISIESTSLITGFNCCVAVHRWKSNKHLCPCFEYLKFYNILKEIIMGLSEIKWWTQRKSIGPLKEMEGHLILFQLKFNF